MKYVLEGPELSDFVIDAIHKEYHDVIHATAGPSAQIHVTINVDKDRKFSLTWWAEKSDE